MDLITGCKQHHPDSQRRLFGQFAPVMMTVCRRYAPDQSGAEDILQEAFIKVFRTIEQYDPQKGAIEGWIRRIVVNTAIEHWRKWHKTWAILPENHIPETAVYASGESNLNEEAILSLIQELPPGFRIVFNLYAIEGYSHAEIAASLHITESTSRSQLTRARKLLQEAFLLQNSTVSDEKL
jgi:RNA polymerase sigma-70 factor (ECF subfamily)